MHLLIQHIIIFRLCRFVVDIFAILIFEFDIVIEVYVLFALNVSRIVVVIIVATIIIVALISLISRISTIVMLFALWPRITIVSDWRTIIVLR